MENLKTFSKAEYICLGLIGIACIVTIARCFFSVDITDESYVYADALMTINGNIPYAYNFSEGAGMNFVTVPFVFLYKLLVPSLEGIVLYMRLVFAIGRLMVVYVIYRMLCLKHERVTVLQISLLLTTYFYFANTFSYNNDSTWGIMLVATILYVFGDRENSKTTIGALLIAGMVTALAVFSNPVYVFSVVVFSISILIYSPKNRAVVYLIEYFCGGIIQIAIAFLGIVKNTGVKRFLYGIKNMFIYKSVQPQSDVYWKAKIYLTEFWPFVLIVGVVLSFALIIRQKCEKNINLYIAVSLLIGVFYSWYEAKGHIDLFELESYLGFLFALISIIIFIYSRNKSFVFFAIPFILAVVMEWLLNWAFSPLAHTAFAFPCVIVIILFERNSVSKVANVILSISIATIFVSVLCADITYVYRDDKLSQLTYTVETGVYKGLKTTERKAICLEEVEEYIYEVTNSIDNIAFRDNVPFAYLMYKGQMCDVRTWDIFEYSYRLKGIERTIYNYYKNRDQIPVRLIYIDFGRDSRLSIERSEKDFGYNKWVNKYYNYVGKKNLNDMFSIQIYDYNGEFNGDFSEWTVD